MVSIKKVAAYTIIGGLAYSAVAEGIRNGNSPEVVDLERKAYLTSSDSLGTLYNPLLPGNTYVNAVLMPWRMKTNDAIIIDRNQRLVLREGVEVPRIWRGSYGECKQERTLEKEDVMFHYTKRGKEVSFSSGIPKNLGNLFAENGLCDYKPKV